MIDQNQASSGPRGGRVLIEGLSAAVMLAPGVVGQLAHLAARE
jgi:hypothetical protein